MELQSAFVTEHPWKDDDDDEMTKTSYLRKERQGARYLATTKRRRKRVVLSSPPSQKRKMLPRIKSKPKIKPRVPQQHKLLPPIEDQLPHTRTRQKHLLNPVEKNRSSLPERLLYSDYFGTRPFSSVDTLGYAVNSKAETRKIAKICGRTLERLRLRDSESLDDEGFKHLAENKKLVSLILENCPSLTSTSLDISRRSHSLLKELHLDGCDGLDDEGIGLVISSLRRLETLLIRGNPRISDLGMKKIGERPRKYNPILDLTLCDLPKVTDKGILAMLRGTARLERLGLIFLRSVTDLSFMGLVSAVGAPACPNLRHVVVNELTGLTASGMQWISVGTPNLISLSLRGCTNICDRALLVISEHSTQITTLNLCECENITDVGLEHLSKTLQKLSTIHLNSCPNISDRGLVTLASKCPELSHLELLGVNRLSDEGIRDLSKHVASLEYIRFTSNQTAGIGKAAYFGKARVTDLSMGILLRQTKLLRVLHVSGFKVGDKSMRHVASSCPHLEELHISGCVQVTDKSLVPIAKSCKHLRSLKADHCVGLTNDTLFALRSATMLRCLHVGFCKTLTDDAVMSVLERTSRLEILSLRYCDELTQAVLVCIGTYCKNTLTSLNVSGISSVTSRGLRYVSKRCRFLTYLNARNTAVVSRRVLKQECEQFLPLAVTHTQGIQLTARPHVKACRARFLFELRLKREIQSVIRIQRRFRVYLERKRLIAYQIAMAKAKRQSQEAAERETRRKMRRIHRAATKICTAARGYLARGKYRIKRDRARRAVILIQSRCRGRIGWRKALKRREEIVDEQTKLLIRMREASVKIERIWRGYSARLNCRLLRGIMIFDRRVKRSAAVTMQCAYRSSRARRITKYLNRMRARRRKIQSRCATRLACCWRRHLAQQFADQLRRDRENMLNRAATQIQAAARGHVARNRFLIRREKYLRSAQMLQRAWRIRAARKIFVALLKARRDLNAFLENKAVMLQNMWRTRHARKIASAARYKLWQKKRRAFASLRIQTCYRRHRAQRLLVQRKKLLWQRKRDVARRTRQGKMRVSILENGAARRIQLWYRSFLERRYLRTQIEWRKKEAAIDIQRVVRGMLTRRYTCTYREVCLRAVLKIQSMFRIRKARFVFFNIVRDKRLEQENARKQLKIDLMNHMREKQMRVQREILENNAAHVIQSGAREWMIRCAKRRVEKKLEAKRKEREERKRQIEENRSFFSKLFGTKTKEQIEFEKEQQEQNEQDGNKSPTSPSNSSHKKKKKRRKLRVMPKVRAMGRAFRRARDSAIALVSKRARMAQDQEKMSRLAYSVLASQKHLFNLDGVLEMHLTVGQEEREKFQIEQDRSKSRKLAYYKMLKADISTRPPDQPLEVYVWVMKKPGATNLVSSIEILQKPVTKTNREFKAILKGWKNDGVTVVMHKDLPFLFHLRRGGKDPITDMKISTKRIDEENLNLAGYTKLDAELKMYVYGEHDDDDNNNKKEEKKKKNYKPFYLWYNVMAIERSHEQKRVAGIMKHQPWYNDRLQHAIDYLSLTEDEVYGLYDQFCEIDTDGGGTLDIDELFAFLEEPKTKIAERFFDWIDHDNSGELDFSEYLGMLSAFCMMGSGSMFQIAFNIVDEDGSGYVDRDEIKKMVEMFECSKRVEKTLMSKVDKLTSGHRDNYVKIDEFRKICQQFPSLLFPIQRLQDRMMHVSMGTRWWRKKRTDFADARAFLKAQQELATRTT